jgi:hypothetical protein
LILRARADDGEAAGLALRRDGLVVLEDFVAPERAAGLREAIGRTHPAYLGLAPLPEDHFKIGSKRFTAPLVLAPPFDVFDILLDPRLDAIASSQLGENWVFEAFGITCSLPGAKEQGRHRDGSLLFGETGLDRVMPASALTFACPLVDFDAVSGRTGFFPGTQRYDDPAEDAAPVFLDLPVGACALWDFRILHFGEANRSQAARPMLYATLCRPFWIDHRNFVAWRNAKLLATRMALDALDVGARKRFARAQLID